MVSGLLGTLVLPARLRKLMLRPKPIPEFEPPTLPTSAIADIEALRRKLAIALRIPAEYLEPALTNISETVVRFDKATKAIHANRIGSPPKILQIDDATEQRVKEHLSFVGNKDSS